MRKSSHPADDADTLPPRLLTTTEELAEFCGALQHEAFVAVDTEFIREKTYYPQLCLIQIAGSQQAAAIDPLAQGIDLAPLLALLTKPSVLKVFHAGRQDLEIVYHLNGSLPAPVFDTQIAAQFLGFGEAISYSDLVRRTAGATIDKASRFTDWSRRPLTARQLEYALADVTYLRRVYEHLVRELAKTGRDEWVNDEMQSLLNPALYLINPEDAFRKIKSGNMKPKQLAVLRAAAAWRESEARRLDIPRGRLIRDEALLELAASHPRTMDELRHVRGTGSLNAAKAEAMLAVIIEALELPPEEWPEMPARKEPTGASADAVALLQMLLSVQCRRHNILPRLVADRDDLEALVVGAPDARVLQDWRYEMFGQHAERLLSGQLKLYFDPKQKTVMLD